MRVATKLRAVSALYVALLAVLLVYLVRTGEHAVDTGHALTAISMRLRITSTDQLGRIAAMSNDAEKYLVTRDGGYLADLLTSNREYGAELRRLDSLPLSAEERARMAPLATRWAQVDARAAQVAKAFEQGNAPSAVAPSALAPLQDGLDQLRAATEQLGAASQDAMTRELDASERAAAAAERFAWTVVLGALLLGGLLSALLVRSIVSPLEQLARGTREVSAGRFTYRLAAGSDGDEFAQVARDFNAMTARLDELDRMKRDFVSRVSHDLKTPLSSMQETISALLDEVAGPLSAKQRQLLDLTGESGRRLSAMLAKLLDLSRIEAGLEPDFALLDVTQLVSRLVEQANVSRAERGATVRLAEPARRQLLGGDAAALAQVFENLLENALKFSPPAGDVVVRVAGLSARGDLVPAERWAAMRPGRVRGGAALVTVADVGPGVPDAEKERIFARFYQTESGRSVRGRGVGLGLTICQDIVNAHGGAIWVADNEPHGSVFCVLLPGAVQPQEESPSPVTATGDAAA